jgi:formylglycine-generating enzyme required for sulfatase activity
VKKLLPVCFLIGCAGFYSLGQPVKNNQGVKPQAPSDSAKTDTLAQLDTFFVPPDTMVLIPGGEYVIGDDQGFPDQRPAHKVKLRSFFIDIHEVTNAQYKVFLEATGHRLPLFWNDSSYNKPHLPVSGVSWDDALAYCRWAGKRLPTEAEWEAAARGGLAGENYPWEGAIKEEKANYRANLDKKPEGIKSIGQYPPNGYGLYDMAGNVYEWCTDYYSPNIYADSSKWYNPTGGEDGKARVIRGGCWNYGAEFLKCAYRNFAAPEMRFNNLGFRGAKNAD